MTSLNTSNESNPFLQLVMNRSLAVLNRLERTIWTPVASPAVEATECLSEPPGHAEAIRLPLQPVDFPLYWGRLYQFRWFKVTVPPAQDGEHARHLQWIDQSQATAWLDGVPYHGFDHYHRQVSVSDEGGTFWLESACHLPVMGPNTPFDPQGSRCEGPALLCRNDEAFKTFHALQVLYDIAVEERMALHPERGRELRKFGYKFALDQASPFYRRLLRLLDECANAYDTAGLPALTGALETAYETLRAANGFSMKAILSGHAHIDLVWLWPERIGEFKTRHTFATVNRLLKDYPEMRFQHGQTAGYRPVERTAPKLMDDIRAHIASGQWEASGAMEVESDTLLPCGEALARSFAFGQEGFTQLNGAPSSLLWLPDVFGYSGCLPQLMNAFGVHYFFTTKLSWNAVNRFPYSSFRWRGPDGAEVVAHLTHEIGYNNAVKIDELRQGEHSYRQADVHDEFLMPTGHGDGGGGPTAEMCERARSLTALAAMPQVSWDTPTAFFERLNEVADRLPVYEGELYFEYHRGTYTTQGAVKTAFRAAERAVQVAESAYAAAELGPVERRWWERLIMAQFHDYIPGTSIPPVYRQALAELETVRAEALSAAACVLAAASGGEECLFNPLPLPLQFNLDGGQLLSLPPLAGVAVNDADAVTTPSQVEVSTTRLDNGHLEADFDTDGWLIGLTVDQQKVLLRGPVELWIYEDHPAFFQAWDIDRQALDTGTRVDIAGKLTTKHGADGTGVISVQRGLGSQSSLTLHYLLRPGRRVIECEIELDWQEPNRLLKVEIPTAYAGQMARYGAPYGSVLRPQKPGDPHAEAMWEVPGSRYAIALDDSGAEGLAVITEAKYGFSCRAGRLSLSLVRSPVQPGMGGGDFEIVYPEVLRTEPEKSVHSDIGRHRIRFALSRFDVSAPREMQPAALAETLYTEPVHIKGMPRPGAIEGISGGSSLIPSWIQPMENGAQLLRLHEVLGRSGTITIKATDGWKATRCTFLGESVGSASGNELDVDFTAYQVVTVRLEKIG